MRVLILSTIFAFATAAPTGNIIVDPVVKAVPIAAALVPGVPAVPVVGVPIPAGDLQAAAIDAKVKAEDQARALAEQALENQNEKVEEIKDQVNEKTDETFWNIEEKKWQAIDAVRTAEAKIDGSIASQAPAIARSVSGGLVLSPIYNPAVAPFVGPLAYAAPAYGPAIAYAAPAAYAAPTLIGNLAQPGIIAPVAVTKTATQEPLGPVKEQNQENAALALKSGEQLKPEEKPSVPSEADLAAAELLKPTLLAAPLAYAQEFKVGEPVLTPIAFLQPELKTFSSSSYKQIQGQVISPTILKFN